MLDKILYVNSNRVVLFFSDRVVNLHSDSGDVLNLLAIVLSPIATSELEIGNEYSDLNKKYASSIEDTQLINTKSIRGNYVMAKSG